MDVALIRYTDPVALKIVLWILFLSGMMNAIWMLASPLHWYQNLPAHVPHYGAYNEHFIRDIGVAFLTASLGLGVAACHPVKFRSFVLLPTTFMAGHAVVHLADLIQGGAASHLWKGEMLLVYLPALMLLGISASLYRR